HTALMHQPFSGVQASGEISVHVLVHAHFDISPSRPFAPSGRSRAYTHALRSRCPHEPHLTHSRERGSDTLAPARDYLQVRGPISTPPHCPGLLCPACPAAPLTSSSPSLLR